MNTTTVTTPNELEIRVERIFEAPRAQVFSVWTDPKLIPDSRASGSPPRQDSTKEPSSTDPNSHSGG